jgi:hypothetical protein
MSAPPTRRLCVAGLLVTTVAAVLRVSDTGQPQTCRLGNRPIRRGVVYDQELVDDPGRDVAVGPL